MEVLELYGLTGIVGGRVRGGLPQTVVLESVS